MRTPKPVRAPKRQAVRIGPNDLCVWEWDGGEPTLLLIHATGFHARCWDAVVARLPEYHCLAIDLRGHGSSTKRGPFGWADFGSDVVELSSVLGLERAVGVGHSLGGNVATQVAARRPGTFASLLLLDPVILAPQIYRNVTSAGPGDEPHFTARRRRYFASPEQMFERFAKRPPYSAWEPEVLRAYCEHGLARRAASPSDAEPFELACPPEIEAEIYSSSARIDIYDLIPRVEIPVHIVRARTRDVSEPTHDFSLSPTWPELASCFPNARDTYVPELSHFIPMQAPERTAGWVREAIAAGR